MKLLIAAFAVIWVLVGGVTNVQAVSEGPNGITINDDGTCQKNILAFPAWFNGLKCDENGDPYLASLNSMWIIGLNIVEMLIVLTAYFAVGYVIWGGFKYIKSQGEPNEISAAKMTIIQAVAGLSISLASVAIVNFIQGGIK